MGTIKYLTTVPEFPAESPLGAPHVIDNLDEVRYMPYPDKLRISDLVATVLYYKAPSTRKVIKEFLKMNKDFHYQRRETSPTSLDFCISRMGKTVQVGYLKEDRVFWDSLHEYRMGDKPTDPWEPVAWKGCCPYPENRAEEIIEMGIDAAREALNNEPWQRTPGATVEHSNM